MSTTSTSSNFDLIFANLDSTTDPDPTSFAIIRNVLSMLNGLNVETVKKNPNDIYMLLKYNQNSSSSNSADSNQYHHTTTNLELSDECCQLIIRIGSLGKLLLKIINYLTYYKQSRAGDSSLLTYPLFDDDAVCKSTLGNIKQYFISSVHEQIKAYHYHLLLIESKLRCHSASFEVALRRILLWTDEWLEKFIFLGDLLKCCLDLKGVALLNAVADQAQHGSPSIRRVGRAVMYATLKPFIGTVFEWLQNGEVGGAIGVDFFIRMKDKETQFDILPPSQSNAEDSPPTSTTSPSDDFEWKLYQLNPLQLPSFLSRPTLKKIYSIGTAVRLLRYMLRDEYDAKMAIELLGHSTIQHNFDAMKKFVYRNVECYGGDQGTVVDGGLEERFFFEHPLVDDFDLLLEAYYEGINEEMFKLLSMSELSAQFETQLGYVLLQRGDFYESLIDYLLPLLRKPATEVVNIVSGSGGVSTASSLHRIFNMFMVNAKLIELSQVYKIDSLLYGNYELNESLLFTFTKTPPPLKHHLGWDIFLTRYRFTKKVYCVLFEGSGPRYERLFRQLFQFRRVLYGIRQTQREVAHYLHRFSRHSTRQPACKLSRPVLQLLRLLHFLLFHQFGFISRLYQHFGSQIASNWSAVFSIEFTRKQKNIDKLVRAHERFLSAVETIVFFRRDHSMMTAFGAVNDSVLDFCECFAATELFPTLELMLAPEMEDFEQLQAVAEALFRHQFKVSIAISKYRCCVGHFIELAQEANLEFKFDILNYGPCLDDLFSCHNAKARGGQTS